ncbi:hypothetical protein B0H13DRAFT_2359414 [Mycena leptocephala]|nr:hypothetical protein B0H13DRAFT_2359414 [Mycena leptocephala]
MLQRTEHDADWRGQLQRRAGTDQDPSPSVRISMGTQRGEHKSSSPNSLVLRGVHGSRICRWRIKTSTHRTGGNSHNPSPAHRAPPPPASLPTSSLSSISRTRTRIPSPSHRAPTSRIDCFVCTSILAAEGQPRRNISARRDISCGARPQHTRSSVNTPPARGHPPRAPPAPSRPNARAHIL